MPKLTTDFRACLRFFAFYLANRTVDLDVLPFGLDFSAVFQEPSALEQVFAIWSNVLDVDEHGRPTNAAAASRRAAQYIREYVEPSYDAEPPFEEWELALHV